jgi:hypothetical protein
MDQDIMNALKVFRGLPQTQQDIHQLAQVTQNPAMAAQVEKAKRQAQAFAYASLGLTAASVFISFMILMVFLRREKREIQNNAMGKE